MGGNEVLVQRASQISGVTDLIQNIAGHPVWTMSIQCPILWV